MEIESRARQYARGASRELHSTQSRIQIEDHRSQWDPARIRRQIQLLNDGAEVRTPVLLSIKNQLLRSRQLVCKRRAAVHLHTERQRVNALPHERIEAKGSLSGKGNGNHKIVNPTQPIQPC